MLQEHLIPIKQNVTALQAEAVLKANGLEITREQTTVVLNYLYALAQNTMSHEESNSLHTSEHR